MSQFTITEEIHADAETALYRGIRSSDGAPVSVKLLKRWQESPREAAKLRYEYMMLRDLGLPGVVTAYGIEQHESGLALVMEDLGEKALREVLAAETLDLATSLKIAASVAETLDALHRRHVIHKDINPQNILVNRSAGTARLRDFGAATRLSSEAQPAHSPGSLEGSLPYISPEQTGRMNRTLDHRTDLYSLGVVLYQMLTGRLPFSSADPMEMVHSHIARRPAPPHEVSPAIPKVVSDIVMKLLAKPAEDRYQSAFGLAADLRECQRQLEAAGSIEPFALGRRDLSGELHIPQRLYGREAETRDLLLAYDRVSEGGVELLLVSGFSGIGKSVLVNEVHKPIAARGGAFISGKFDLLNRSLPYAPIANAFRELIRGVLQGPADEIDALNGRLLRALGQNAQLLIDLIPELSILLGPQPAVPELSPAESQNRFALVFQSFLQVFATKGRPLVLFLDDLQWADSASLKLLQTVLANEENHYLLVLGAYRDNEVGPAHPLTLTIDDMKKMGAKLSEITLKPLSPATVTQLLADTFLVDGERASALSEVIFEKTQGNPFFMSQLLGALHRNKLIGFNVGAGAWEWDIEGIKSAAITDNVVALMVSKIERLAPSTQRILQLASCIGHQFDLRTLAVIYEKTPAATAADLWEALREGLFVPLTAEYRFLHAPAGEGADDPQDLGALRVAYKFLHDRVQQAAYSMIDEAQRQEIHLKIGRLLRGSRGAEGEVDDVFQVVHHTNIGASLINDRREQVEMARLNLVAGKKAKSATAFQTAAGYFAAGVRLLGEAGWDDEYEATFALSSELAECQYLIGQLDEAEALFDVILRRAKTDVERGEIYNLKMVLYGGLVRYAEGIAAARTALALLGIHIPETEAECGPLLGAELGQVHENLRGRTLEEVLNSPVMVDPVQRIALKILGNLFVQAFIGNPVLLALISVKQANIALKYGHSEEAAFGYVVYAFVLAAIGQYQAAYDFGQLALGVCEKFNAVSVRCRLYLIYSMHVSFGSRPIRQSLDYVRRAIRSGPESGDLNFLSFAICNIGWTRMTLGDAVGAVREEIEKYTPLVRQTYNPGSILNTLIGRQLTACLQGLTRGPQSFEDETVDEAKLEAQLQAPELAGAWGWYNSCKLRVAVLADDDEAALRFGAAADKVASASTGLAFTIDQAFHLCLVLLRLPAEEASAQPLREMIERSRARLFSYAEGCPENFLHKKLLVEAEEARVAGSVVSAMELYDKAIEAAKANGFTHDEALAHETAAKHYLSLGREKVARAYMADAHRCYRAWGAATKVAQLEQKYGALIAAQALSAADTLGQLRGTSGIDAMTVVKAAQALSDEIDLSRLLQKLMRIAIENAGAGRGLLLRDRGGELWLEAEAMADTKEVTVFQPAAALPAGSAPLGILGHVRRTRESVVLDDAASDKRFADDEHLAIKKARSVLCLPLVRQAELVGILYLENNLASGAFTPERISTLELLASQAAISLENARLYSELSRENAERRRAEEAVRELNAELELRIQERTAQLQLANKELEAFSYSVSHDLRAPLRVIDGFSLALLEDYSDKLDDDGREYLSRVRWASGRMSELIDDMLKLSRVARAEMKCEHVDMSALAGEVIRELSRSEPGRAVEWVVAEGIRANGDEALLRIALENLLGNAWKFTSKRPSARIEVGKKDMADGRAAYFVRDDGAGFDMRYASKLFGTFQRLHSDDDFKGTGVGLATVQRIVARHGGRIWAEGAVGEGATFYFTL